jgi:OmcA/MtrC family decaheme c-type cytochrome
VFFRTDGGAVEPRREVVDDAACASCHGEPFAGHGEDRIGVGVCVVCHNSTLTSTPDDITLPTVTVNMKDMIHRIHTGEELADGYVTGGHSGDVDFSEVVFPGIRQQCSVCHGDHDVSLPLDPAVLPTVIDDGVNPVTTIEPTRAACNSCHDGLVNNIHAILATDGASGVETCSVCHGPGAEADPALFHVLAP